MCSLSSGGYEHILCWKLNESQRSGYNLKQTINAIVFLAINSAPNLCDTFAKYCVTETYSIKWLNFVSE